MKQILIYDDDYNLRERLSQGLSRLPTVKSDYEIKSLDDEEFKHVMAVLRARQKKFREKGVLTFEEKVVFDSVSILVVDYDLVGTGPFLTGETVAYFARCFSHCEVIIGVNQYGHNSFDLTLKGHPESFADLNVGQEQLANPNLWGEEKPGFHPWYWPSLPDYLSNFERRVADVKDSLKNQIPVHEVLNFPVETFEMLPRSIVQFIGPEPNKVTFPQFVLESGNSLKEKDALRSGDIDEIALSRIGAARLSKWLERLVLPGQDILVDAPHLVSRFPCLLDGDSERINDWNKTAHLTAYTNIGLKTDVIDNFRFKRDHWISRPVWFWGALRECEVIEDVKEPWKISRPDWVFCEDASEFFSKDCREFVADLDSPFARRYVKMFDGVDYRPKARFSY